MSKMSEYHIRGISGSAEIPFDNIEGRQVLVDPAIYPFLWHVNRELHYKTVSSCAGHDQHAYPFLLIYLTEDQYLKAYTWCMDHLKQRSKQKTISGLKQKKSVYLQGTMGTIGIQITAIDQWHTKNAVYRFVLSYQNPNHQPYTPAILDAFMEAVDGILCQIQGHTTNQSRVLNWFLHDYTPIIHEIF